MENEDFIDIFAVVLMSSLNIHKAGRNKLNGAHSFGRQEVSLKRLSHFVETHQEHCGETQTRHEDI